MIWNVSNSVKIKYFIRPSSSDELRIVFKRFLVVVQSHSHVWLFATSWTEACQASLLSLGGCSNSCMLSQWCHPTISSSVIPFSSFVAYSFVIFKNVSWHLIFIKAMPKNVQTTAQLDSSHMLAKKSSKFSKQGFKQDMNQELPDIQAWFRKGRGTRDQIANIHWIREKETEFQKNIYFCFIDYAKAFDCMDHNKLRKSS